MPLLFSSIDLITLKPYSLLTEFEDKIFISGILTSINSTSISVLIDKNCPLFALNDRVAKEFQSRSGFSIDTVKSLQIKVDTQHILLSAGALVNVVKYGQLGHILLKKDNLAPTDAGHLTEPAGRCGEHPYETIFKELNEELDIALAHGGDKTLLAVGPDCESLSPLQEKLFAIKEKNAELNFKQSEIHTIEYLEVEHSSTKLDRICCITIDNEAEKISTEIIGPHFFNENTQTLEIRQRFILGLNDEDLLYFDGEPFGREVDVFTTEELFALPKTEYLSIYLDGGNIK